MGNRERRLWSSEDPACNDVRSTVFGSRKEIANNRVRRLFSARRLALNSRSCIGRGGSWRDSEVPDYHRYKTIVWSPSSIIGYLNTLGFVIQHDIISGKLVVAQTGSNVLVLNPFFQQRCECASRSGYGRWKPGGKLSTPALTDTTCDFGGYSCSHALFCHGDVSIQEIRPLVVQGYYG